jgi:hypothetical protein
LRVAFLRPRSDSPQFFLLLAGAAILAGLAIVRLPRFPDLVHAPSTPFDRSAPDTADVFRLFQMAAAVIPPGGSVASLSQPRHPARETELHRQAVALLPGRKVIPAALWDLPTGREAQAEFLIVAGPRPSPPPGTLLAEMPRGSVWRRVRP